MKKLNFVFLVFSLVWLAGCSAKLTEKKLVNQLGVNAKLVENIYCWESGQDIQGEGFKICVNSLSLKEGDLINTNYPISDINKENWYISTWKESPVSLEYFDILLQYNVKEANAKKYILDMKNALNSKNNYYCYYYLFAKDTDVIIGIDLYVIDTKSSLIYNSEIIM